MSLQRLTERLLKNPNKKNFNLWRKLVLRKRDNLISRGNNWAYNYEIPENLPLESLQEYIDCLNISCLFGYEHEVRLRHETSEGIITFLDEKIHSFRKNERIIIDNPVVGPQSWYKIKFPDYNKHSFVSKNKHASKYLKGLDSKQLEREVFNLGRGYLDERSPATRMFLIHDFKETIGTSGNTEVSSVRIQVDRMKDTHGWYCLIHGYPYQLIE